MIILKSWQGVREREVCGGKGRGKKLLLGVERGKVTSQTPKWVMGTIKECRSVKAKHSQYP